MRVRWTEAAARDLTGICDYTEEHSGPEAARKVAVGVYETVGTLLEFPHLGRSGRKQAHANLSFPGYLFLLFIASAQTLSKLPAFCMAHRSGRSGPRSRDQRAIFGYPARTPYSNMSEPVRAHGFALTADRCIFRISFQKDFCHN